LVAAGTYQQISVLLQLNKRPDNRDQKSIKVEAMEGQIKVKSERKFLETGATGATGRETVKLLRESGHAVRALVHREDGYGWADTPL
jgi:hypothetical protein